MRAHELMGVVDSLRFKQKMFIAKPLDTELILFERESNTAYCLNDVAGEIWNACGKGRTAAEITDFLGGRRPDLGVETVFDCLSQMAASGLLEETVLESISVERRELIRRAALMAAALLPIAITSVVIPPAAAAASCAQVGHACSPTHPCCPGGIIPARCTGGICL